MELQGKVAVITGGASGIGRALAVAARDAGAEVVVADVEQGALDATATELGVLGVRTDVRLSEDVAALADRVVERHGGLDLLCLNAGVSRWSPIRETTLLDWQWVLEVNLWGVVHGLHHLLPHVRDGGHVVTTASLAGLTPVPYIGAYNASKYAVVGLSETLREELEAEGRGIGVSILCPGFVRTNIFTSQRNRPEERRNPTRARSTHGHGQTAEAAQAEGLDPDEVARQVLEAVRERRPWVLTHGLPDEWDRRVAEVEAAAGRGAGS